MTYLEALKLWGTLTASMNARIMGGHKCGWCNVEMPGHPGHGLCDECKKEVFKRKAIK